MNLFRNALLLIALSGMFGACNNKKKPSLSGDEPIEASDFLEFFPEKKLPFQVGDSIITRKEKDTLYISQKVFSQFVPDSFLAPVFGKTTKLKIYPVGRVAGDANYLFAKVVSGDKRAAYVFAFNKKDLLLDGIPLMRTGQYAGAHQLVGMDKNYSITKIITRKNSDGSTSDGKDVYGLNTETGKFMLIMTDALDDRMTELVNPIDTFSKKHKYAGDYGTAKMNLVSFRDGRKSDRLSFYVHLEKSQGACTGDLRGEAVFTSANVAEYRQGGDPCVLKFTFTSSSVIVKEVEGCGARRGLRCSFDGTFSKKKEPKPAKKKNK